MNKENETEEQIKEKSKLQKLLKMWKTPKGKAKIKLCLYGIFFVGVIIFARVLGAYSNNLNNNNNISDSFLNTISDNYQYNIEINLNNNLYEYYGKKLGYNGTMTIKSNEEEKFYSILNNKYYMLDNGNYMLVTDNEIYPYLPSHYLDINLIKEYIKMGIKENNTYKVNLTDIILNTTNENHITITISEEEKSVLVDYTELFKLNDPNTNVVTVKITYQNINNINTLEE